MKRQAKRLITPLVVRRGRDRIRAQGRAVLVHSMGKVGSTSVYRTLRRTMPDTPVFHTHVLNSEHLAVALHPPREFGPRSDLAASAAVQPLLASASDQIDWKIISLVREPVGRNLSAFFENLGTYAPDERRHLIEQGDDVDLVRTLFLERFPHDLPLRWFDEQIREPFGIDVFTEPFSTTRGYRVYKRSNISLLVVRLEDLDRVGGEALGSFLGIAGFVPDAANRGSDKPYARLYGRVKQEIELGDEYLRRLYDSGFARHFYSEGERGGFWERWRV